MISALMIRALTVTSIPSTLKSVRNPSPAATTTSPDPLALDRQVCFALAVASRNVIALYRPLLEPMGIKGLSWGVWDMRGFLTVVFDVT